MQHDKNASDTHDAVIAAIESGCTMGEAAKVVGVNRTTLYRWMAADPEFADRVNAIRDDQDDQVEAVTLKNCLNPDPAHNTLRMFWLKCRRPSQYRDTVRAELTGAAGGPIKSESTHSIEPTAEFIAEVLGHLDRCKGQTSLGDAGEAQVEPAQPDDASGGVPLA